MKNNLVFIIILCCYLSVSCNARKIPEDVEHFYNSKVVIPYDKLERKKCSLFADSSFVSSKYKIVNYIDEFGCTTCKISKLSKLEKQSSTISWMKNIPFVYIVNVTDDNVDMIYSMLCNTRIEGYVYFDSNNIFKKNNPSFPKAEIFNTFVLNDNNEVVFVGSPLKNQKTLDLFYSVVNNDK